MALIFDIKRFSINDGPGIRTTLFLKGCPLHCVWCHNPEGCQPKKQKLYNRKKCIGCQTCVDVCPQKVLELTPQGIVSRRLETGGTVRDLCLLCGKCVEGCPTKALEMSGREWPMEELMAVVEKERKVMEDSGGGVTLCGGEPLIHPQYTLELLRELGRRQFHRCVDTTLYASPDTVRRVAAECELLLVDLKHMDPERHLLYTGVSNELILSNLQLISQLGKPYWIRIPLIDNVNSDPANIEASAAFLASLPQPPQIVNLLPYHDIGKGKHERMGTEYNPSHFDFATPSEETQQRCIGQFSAHGLKAIIGG